MKENIAADEDQVTLKVRDAYYSEDSIQEVLDLFKENFNIEKDADSDYLKLKLEVKDNGVNVNMEQLGLEFFNHLLSEEKSGISMTLG